MDNQAPPPGGATSQAEWSATQAEPAHVASGSSTPDASASQFFIAGGWDMTQPTGSSAEFANVFGVQSASLQLRYQGQGRASFGGLIAWQSWSAKNDHTSTEGSVTIGGTQARGVYINPIYARAQFALFDIRAASSHKKPVPYAAMNFGGAHMVRRVDIGISSLTEDSWHWGFAPELGVEIPLSRLVAIAGVRFNYLVASGEGPEQLYFTFTLGVGAF